MTEIDTNAFVITKKGTIPESKLFLFGACRTCGTEFKVRNGATYAIFETQIDPSDIREVGLPTYYTHCPLCQSYTYLYKTPQTVSNDAPNHDNNPPRT